MITVNLSTHSSEESLKDQVLISVKAFIHTQPKNYFKFYRVKASFLYSPTYQSRCRTKVTCFILIIFTAEIHTCNLEQCTGGQRSSLHSALCAQPR